jgi:hypothetical protein
MKEVFQSYLRVAFRHSTAALSLRDLASLLAAKERDGTAPGG